MKGWISLHRKLLENPLLKTRQRFSRREAWIWLLLKANYEANKFAIGSDIYQLKAGQMITSQKKLCAIFKWGNSRLRTFLKLLENDGMIRFKPTNKLTLITICNYDSYQNNKYQPTNKQKANEHQSDTNNNNNKKNKLNKEERESTFINLVCAIGLDITPNPHPDLIKDFTDYWTESNTNGSKMKFEMQKTFDVKRRLQRWINNQWDTKKPSTDISEFKRTTNGHLIGYCHECNGESMFYKEWEIKKGTGCKCNSVVQPRRKI
jgi:hypothetical protein